MNTDGTLGERNMYKGCSVEHKLGIRGFATCVMGFEEAEAFLQRLIRDETCLQ